MSHHGRLHTDDCREAHSTNPLRRNAAARNRELTAVPGVEADNERRALKRHGERTSEDIPQFAPISQNVLNADNSQALADWDLAYDQVDAVTRANPNEISLARNLHEGNAIRWSIGKEPGADTRGVVNGSGFSVGSIRPIATPANPRHVTMSGGGNQFSFGQPGATSAGGPGGGLFSSAGAASNPFGSQNTSQAPNTGGGSLFGNTATSGPGSGGLFGSAGNATSNNSTSVFGKTSTASNPFGAAGSTATSGATQKPLFGSATNSSSGFGSGASGTSAFKLPTANTTSTTPPASATPVTSQASGGPSLFGNASGNTSGGFGTQQQTASPASGGSTSPWSFGNLSNNNNTSTTAASGAGTISASNTDQTPSSAPSGTSLFAPKPQSAGAPSLFGATSTTPTSSAQQPNKPSIFASSTPPASGAPASGGLFSGLGGGSTTPQPTRPSPLNFSTTPAGNPPTNSIFGTQQLTQAPAASSATATSTAPAFSFPGANASTGASTSGTATTSGPLFGEVNKSQTQAPSQPATSAPLFGSNTQSPTPATGSSSLFPPPAQGTTPSSQPSAGGLFGKVGGSTATASSAPSLFTAAQPTSAAEGQTGGAAQPAAKTAPSLFSLGGQTAASSSAQPASTTATSAPSLFGGAAPTGTTTTATTQATSTGAPAAAGTTFSGTASTSGPAPPTSSRLAQKSMDEILTTWSTSLASHQKTFQQLATQVSKWDRQLVENSSKISSLYGRCFQAERDCTEVERQLSVVEHGQVELEAALERYEAQVDRMMESAGVDDGALGGVEGERERTYKTAEACSTRLGEMSHTLTDMIEEINLASNRLSNTPSSARQDDPLAQIVRVLNSHLTQLQTIDEGARDLSHKVESAQQDARILGQRAGVNGGGWIEGFGKAYLGRS